MRFFPQNPCSAARLGLGLSYVSVLVLTVSAAFSQNPVLKTRTKEEREERLAATHRITLNVQVTDSSGNAVSDLHAADFKLYDNHQTRKIASFHAIYGQAFADATDILIVLDAVNSSEQTLATEKNAIFKFLVESHKPFTNPTGFALWFNGHLSAMQPTIDRNAVGRAFVKLTKGLHSNDCAGEKNLAEPRAAEQKISMGAGSGKVDPATCRAVHFRDSIAALDGIALQQVAKGGRTLLIWVGPGWPRLSSAEIQRIAPRQQQELANQFVTMLRDFRAAQMTVYSIAPTDSTQPPGAAVAPGPAIVNASDPPGAMPGLTLDEFAKKTGGRARLASTDVMEDLKTCMRDADWYYAVSFNAPPAQNGPGELHLLEIQVDRPGVEVRTMNAYYPEP